MKKRPFVLVLAAVVAAAVAALVVAQRTGEDAPERRPPPPVPVVVAAVETGVVRALVEAVGEARPIRDAHLSTEAGGRVVFLAEEGAELEKGEVLARLDAEAAAASVRSAAARVGQLEAEAAQRRRDLARVARLVEAGVAAEEEVELARTAVETAEALLDAARADLAAAREALGDFTVRAPFDGVVLSRKAEVGEVVSPGSPLVRFGDVSTLEVAAFVPEADAVRVAAGDPALVAFDALPGESFPARVVRVDRVVAPGARTAEVILRLPNPGRPPLPAGLLARIHLEAERREGVLRIPAPALHSDVDGAFVWRIEDDRAYRRPVEVGLAGCGFVEIRAGLAAGDSVVVRGAESLTEAAPVLPAS